MGFEWGVATGSNGIERLGQERRQENRVEKSGCGVLDQARRRWLAPNTTDQSALSAPVNEYDHFRMTLTFNALSIPLATAGDVNNSSSNVGRLFRQEP